MPSRGDRQEEHFAVAGPRAHLLSVVTITVMFLFVLVVLALVVSDVAYLHYHKMSLATVWNILSAPDIRAAVGRSLYTSLITLGVVIVFSIPTGYALSRYRFFGHAVINTLVDIPIVMPPVVVGVSLLAFFATPLGGAIRRGLEAADWSLTSSLGIVLCQFVMAVSYSIRASKAAFDGVDRDLEHVAMTLGCTHGQAFRQVTLPLARGGLLAGCIVAWARAIGVFGPLMVFVGTSPRVLVMPTAIQLELSVGKIEVALAVALVMLAMAGVALAAVHWLESGERWWGR